MLTLAIGNLLESQFPQFKNRDKIHASSLSYCEIKVGIIKITVNPYIGLSMSQTLP